MFDSVILQFMPTLLFARAATILSSAIMFRHGVAAWAVCFVAFQVFVSYLRRPYVRRAQQTRVTANSPTPFQSGDDHVFGRSARTAIQQPSIHGVLHSCAHGAQIP